MSNSDVYERAERIYADRLRVNLEQSHANTFVAIEPESGDYFLGRTLSEAAAAARVKYPDRRCGVIRVGHSTTVHIG